MSEQFREQLSALMDGELPRDEVRFLLRRIDGDAALAAAWTRYQLAGGILRRQAALLPLRADFTARLLQRVGAEPGTGVRMRVLRWAGGGAIAAAVAVLALVSTQPAGTQPEPAATLATVPPAAAAPVAPVTRVTALPLPMQPAFDLAQPASLDRVIDRVVPLPRYHYELGNEQPLGPYVPLTLPPSAETQSTHQ